MEPRRGDEIGDNFELAVKRGEILEATLPRPEESRPRPPTSPGSSTSELPAV